jgi:hypothetical protein
MGSLILGWETGLGQWTPSPLDGALSGAAPPTPWGDSLLGRPHPVVLWGVSPRETPRLDGSLSGRFTRLDVGPWTLSGLLCGPQRLLDRPRRLWTLFVCLSPDSPEQCSCIQQPQCQTVSSSTPHSSFGKSSGPSLPLRVRVQIACQEIRSQEPNAPLPIQSHQTPLS